MTTEQPESSESNSTKIIAGVILAIVILCVCMCCISFLGLNLLGPTVGNVFSNIIEELATPMP